MSNPIIRIHNTETDEIIDREMTDDEFEQYELEQEANEQENANRQAELTAKETARQALLDKLGITEVEAQILLG